ncbi:hypothetical protein NP233_g8584 [Leucocoprinus birnbaumii]|uniref:xylan 1,4-beta-xylosidase n=1 Tax=Leucocoprinus birnbaumii TaxID=56174 RepID=A0AAD5VPH8_9AGAR|nr:hypothetical protein NP233_g8584 [Leucocoprinus birnbaumii]
MNSFISLTLAALVGISLAQFNYSYPDCANGPLKDTVVCDTSKNALIRARALIQMFTIEELTRNADNLSPGVPRLGVPPYQWWSEALHGVAGSPGVTFASSGNFSSATSFPQPIVLGATFDMELVKAAATVTSTEARAFNNAGRAGLDFWTPNINPFRDPRWGRGQETPGEDPFLTSQYVLNLIDGLQGGIDPHPYYKVAADCKHYAAYDLENWEGINRSDFDAQVSLQDLSEYYLPSFQSCVRDAKVASVMCSFNSVNGIPSCANSYLLQKILRDFWKFGDDRWVVADCDAVENIFEPHNFTQSRAEAAAAALRAGTDIDCGTTYSAHLPEALNQSLITRADLEQALTRQYSSLMRLGYFDPPASQPYRQLDWSDVNKPDAEKLAYRAAVEGLVLIKNSHFLPLSGTERLAIIGPYANATTAMQGNYFGAAPFVVTPLQGSVAAGFQAQFAHGTDINTSSDAGFEEAMEVARSTDVIVFAGGIDHTIEDEANDRLTITWPGNQLKLIQQLATLGKPIVVIQFGGGQLDDTELLVNDIIRAVIWAGYPGQSGGSAIFDIIAGKEAPAGRLTATQYPATYTKQTSMTDMSLRPSASSPGRTYKWYSGKPVVEFGHGLHYTTFEFSWRRQPPSHYDIQHLISSAQGHTPLDLATFDIFQITIHNTGRVTSDYVALLFLSGDAGPAPRPNKSLVSFNRTHGIKPGSTSTAHLQVTLGSLARADERGDLWLFAGSYRVILDAGKGVLTHDFVLAGSDTRIVNWPQPFL